MAFVLGMQKMSQSTVVALVNKELSGPRRLQRSVLFNHELPTLSFAAWGLDRFWSPHVLVIDMRGRCLESSGLLRRQLYKGVEGLKGSKSLDFAKRSELTWSCLDCPPATCELEELAQEVASLVEALGGSKSMAGARKVPEFGCFRFFLKGFTMIYCFLRAPSQEFWPSTPTPRLHMRRRVRGPPPGS